MKRLITTIALIASLITVARTITADNGRLNLLIGSIGWRK